MLPRTDDGKCNRGLSVVDSYKILKGVDVLSHEDAFLACTLGWCNEYGTIYAISSDFGDRMTT